MVLEVMEERRVTVDGVSHEVGEPFMVIATQNPIEQAGTYRLPEAQLDRFIMKTSLGYPDHAATVSILAARSGRAVQDVEPIVTADMVTKMAVLAEGIHVAPEVIDYITRHFKVLTASYKFLDRETGFTEIAKGHYERII